MDSTPPLDRKPRLKRSREEEQESNGDSGIHGDDRGEEPMDTGSGTPPANDCPDSPLRENGTDTQTDERNCAATVKDGGEPPSPRDPGGSTSEEPLSKKRRKDVSPAKYFETIEEKLDEKTKNYSKYGCSLCSKLYKWKKSLNKHWKEKHDGHPGDNSSTPPGMVILLDQGVYCQVKSRLCIKKQFLDKIEVKEDVVASSDASQPSTPVVFSSSAVAEVRDNLGDEMDGDDPRGASNSNRVPPAGSFISGTDCQPAIANNPRTLLDNLNCPLVIQETIRSARSSGDDDNDDETDGVDKAEVEPGIPEEDAPEQRPASTSSSYASCGSYVSRATGSPASMTELEKELQALDTLEAAKGPPEGRGVVLTCPCCHQVSKTQTEYGRHVAKHLPPSFSTYWNVTKCAACRRHFLDKATLNGHFSQQHSDRLRSLTEAPETSPSGRGSPTFTQSDSLYSCLHCTFTSKWKAEMHKHSVSHSDDRPCECVVCGSTYKRKWDLGKHYNSSHRGLANPYQSPPKPATSKDGGTKPGSSRGSQPEEGQVAVKPAIATSPSPVRSEYTMDSSARQPAKSGHASVSPGAGGNSLPRVLQASVHTASVRTRQAVSRGEKNGTDQTVTKRLDSKTQSSAQTARETTTYKCNIVGCYFRCVDFGDLSKHWKSHEQDVDKTFGCSYCDYRTIRLYDASKHVQRCSAAGDRYRGKEAVVIYDVEAAAKEASVRVMAGVVPGNHIEPPGQVPRSLQQSSIPSAASRSPALVARLHAGVTPQPKKGAATVSTSCSSLLAPGLSSSVVRANSRTKSQVPIKCVLCPFETNSDSALTSHIKCHTGNTASDTKQVTQKNFKCPNCCYTTNSLTTYIEHRAAHRTGNGSEQLRHSPILNGEEVDEARIRHPRKAVKWYKCKSCTFVCSKNIEFLEHLKQEQGENKCKWCLERWNTKENYLDHITTHPEFDPDDLEWESFFMNNKTNDDVNNNQGVAESGSAESKEDTATAQTSPRLSGSAPSSSENAIKCQWCGLEFRNVIVLFEHSKKAHPAEFNRLVEDECRLQTVQERRENVDKLAGVIEKQKDGVSPLRSEKSSSNQRGITVDVQVDDSAEQGLHQSDRDTHYQDRRKKGDAVSPKAGSSTPNWMHTQVVSTFQGTPVQLCMEDGEVQYKCIFCTYSHQNPGSVVRHVKKKRHAVPKKYQCDLCQWYQSDEVREVMNHQVKDHNNESPSITVRIRKEIQVSTQQQDTVASQSPGPLQLSGPKDSSPISTLLGLPSLTAALILATFPGFQSPLPEASFPPGAPQYDESECVPLDLSSRTATRNRQGDQSGSPSTSEKTSVDLSAAPPQPVALDEASTPPHSSEKEKNKSAVRSLFRHSRSRKSDLQAREVIVVEKDVTAVEAKEAEACDVGEQKALLQCKHCPFTCHKGFLLRNHCRLHGLSGRYACDYCTFTHQDRSQILQHRAVHSNQENFKSAYESPGSPTSSSSA